MTMLHQNVTVPKLFFQFSLFFGWNLGTEVSFQGIYTAQKMKFSIKDFFCKCDQIRGFGHIY